jgi:protein SCO1
MDRRALLTKLFGAAGAGVVLLPGTLFGEKSNGKLAPPPCKLPVGGPRAGYFPNAVFINQDYYKGRFYDDLVMGKTVVFSTFATTNPSPLQKEIMANLVELQKYLGDRLGRDVFVHSISYDPKHDTPPVLHAYAQHLGIRAGWSLLTGRPEDVNLVLAKLGLGYVKMAGEVMAPHFGILRIGNEALDRWTTMPAVFEPPMILQHLSLVEVKPERKDLKRFVRAGPSAKDVEELTHLKRAGNETLTPVMR